MRRFLTVVFQSPSGIPGAHTATKGNTHGSNSRVRFNPLRDSPVRAHDHPPPALHPDRVSIPLGDSPVRAPSFTCLSILA